MTGAQPADGQAPSAHVVWFGEIGVEKLDAGIFHVVEKYELLQKQAQIEFDAELFLRDIDDVGERGVVLR